MDRAGHFGHRLFFLPELIYYEFNGGVKHDSYERRIQKRTCFGSRIT